MKKSNPLPSFFWRVYITSVVLVFLTLVCVTVIFRNIQKKSYLGQIEREFATEAYLLSQIFSNAQDPSVIDQWRLRGKPRVTLMNGDGEVLLETMYNPFTMENQRAMPEVSVALGKGWGTSIRWCPYVGMKMFFVAGYFEYDESLPMIVRLAIPLYQIKKSMNNSTSMIILGGVVIFIVFSIFGLIITREITSPIMRIALIIKEFSNGKIGVRLPLFRNRELNLLSTELNRMIENLTRREGELSVVKDQTLKILSSMHDGIILVENNGIIRQANRASGEIFGYDEKALLGKNIHAVLRSEELYRGIRSIENGYDMVKSRIRVFLPDERYIEFSCSPFGDGHGVLILLHDITRIAHLERVQSEFVANVSHELKTPITTLKGFVDTLIGMNQENTPAADVCTSGKYSKVALSGSMKMDILHAVSAHSKRVYSDGSNPEGTHPGGLKTQKKFLDIIHRNVLRMENIVEDLLTLSRIEAGAEILSDNPVNVNSCILNAISIIEARFVERKVCFSGNEFVFFVKGDESLLELVFVNLLDNAMKYSSRDVNVSLDANYRKVFISIADQGVGIPESEMDKIFESFYRVDKARSRALGGTGLGLTIVKRLVEAHKGCIRVKSRIGEGSLFKLEFPRFIQY